MRIRHPLVLASVCLGYFMAVLDSTVVNVALPDMARSLGTGIAGMQWVVDGYALLFASLLLTAGALGDRLGNRGMFVAGLALFTLASALCGIAPSLGALVAFRALQGVGAAVQVPASLALLRHAYHDPAERAQAIGIWAAATGVAVAAGPVVGGVPPHAATWRSVFLVNLPVGVLGIVLTLRHVPPVPPHHDGDLDLTAQALGITALGGLTFGLIQGGVWGWASAPVILALLVAAVAAVLFYLGERRAAHPMLPPALFRDATFSAANAVGAILSFGFYGELFLMSLFFQQVQHRSPLAAGLALLPQTAVISLMNFVSGQVTARRGARLPMALGLAIGGAGRGPPVATACCCRGGGPAACARETRRLLPAHSQHPSVRPRSFSIPALSRRPGCRAVTVCSLSPLFASPPASAPRTTMASILSTWTPPALLARTSTASRTAAGWRAPRSPPSTPASAAFPRPPSATPPP